MQPEIFYILGMIFAFIIAPCFAFCASQCETEEQRNRRYELETLQDCHDGGY